MAHRFVVIGKRGARRMFTDVQDAVAYAQRRSRTKRGTITRVCEGQPGSEKLIVTCTKNRCGKPNPKQPKACFPRAPLRKGDMAHMVSARTERHTEMSGARGRRRKRRK
jgi:hypothetical protein